MASPHPIPGQNPAPPDGWRPMKQSEVTKELTEWAVKILRAAEDYPMFGKEVKAFSVPHQSPRGWAVNELRLVMARVEWHPPDPPVGPNHIHRGVTLYLRREEPK